MAFFPLLIRLVLGAGLLITAEHATAQVGSQASSTTDLKDGAYRQNGQVMRLQAGKASRLTAPMQFENGLTLRPDGTMVSKNGVRQPLPEGRALNMQGQLVNLRDDMKTAAAIERHDQQVTGAKPTVVSMPAPALTVAPTVMESLRRTEERLATLQQLTALLNERATAPNTSPTLDSQIQALSAKLKP